jgi:hypothetical protein
MSNFYKVSYLILPLFLGIFLLFGYPAMVNAGCCKHGLSNSTCDTVTDDSSCQGGTNYYSSGDCSSFQGCPGYSANSGASQPSGSGGTAGKQKLPNPLDPQDKGITIYDIPGRVIKALLGLTGAIALVMFIYGGFLMMFSGGNPSTVKKGKDTLVMAVLGLVVIFASYAIVNFIITSITK